MELRDWRQQRRDRTHTLIEYGRLVVKAGIAEQVEDDPATLLGALLMIRSLLGSVGGDAPATLKAEWRRQGLRALEVDAAAGQGGEADLGFGRDDGRSASGDNARGLDEAAALGKPRAPVPTR